MRSALTPSDMLPASLATDPLSAALWRLRLSVLLAQASTLHGPFGIAVPSHHGGFYAVQHGTLWLRVDDAPPVCLHAGDVSVVIGEGSHVISDAPEREARPFIEFITRDAALRRQGLTLSGSGAMTRFVCGGFAFGGLPGDRLLSALPRLVVLRAAELAAGSMLPSVLALLAMETRTITPGTFAVASQLAGVIFHEAVRAHARRLGGMSAGVIGAMFDEHLGPLLALMHANPGGAWTTHRMALESGLSRSVFCERFVRVVGVAPSTYLRELRLNSAATALAEGRDTVRQIAARSGYASEAAFTHAFRRMSGMSPVQWRAERSVAGLSPESAGGGATPDPMASRAGRRSQGLRGGRRIGRPRGSA